ncbi:Nidogen-1 [Larimichthys crocea]|uniref:Uncharacterized protein n=1 Tax=Larimichthys crocea TaxID=215358 RepID=A0ACD3RUN2_LARCR|nr:Nidogen-1 [Larimichthys crocea]
MWLVSSSGPTLCVTPVEVSKLDGSQRRVLFDTDLINPRPIVTNPAYGRLYWADWNRDGPKIEMSNMDGTDRTVLVKDDLGLPNGLTFDLDNQQLCWADAGTRKVECMDPHRRLRRQIVEGIQYPFGLVSFGRNLYYTDWRREAGGRCGPSIRERDRRVSAAETLSAVRHHHDTHAMSTSL